MKLSRIVAVVLCVVFVLTVPAAVASDRPVCTLSVSTTAASTTSPTSGTCSWQPGSRVKMQCTVAVYYRADGKANATADQNSVKVDFTVNPDPYAIDLALTTTPAEKAISVITASGTGTCGFFIPIDNTRR